MSLCAHASPRELCGGHCLVSLVSLRTGLGGPTVATRLVGAPLCINPSTFLQRGDRTHGHCPATIGLHRYIRCVPGPIDIYYRGTADFGIACCSVITSHIRLCRLSCFGSIKAHPPWHASCSRSSAPSLHCCWVSPLLPRMLLVLPLAQLTILFASIR